jgi:WD40 repeat protein
MTTTRRSTLLGTIAIAGALLWATRCGDPNAPANGALRVAVATTGGDLDLDGYGLTVDGGPPHVVAGNGIVVITGLPPGQHELELSGVADNCAVSGPNPRSTTVTAGGTTEVPLAVACVATGVQISIATTGADRDPDGYAVAVDGGAPQAIGVNGTLAITRLSAGGHTVALSGAADNCAVGGENPRSVTISALETLPVSFAVTCGATSGAVEVTSVTSGIDLDSNYTVRLDNGTPITLAPNGKIAFSGVNAGSHTVLLDGIAGNCTTVDNPRVVQVTTGGTTRDTARATFQFSCVATAGVVEVSSVTSGMDLDLDGYAVRVDNGSPATLAINGKTAFAGVSGGNHTITLAGAPGNCTIAGTNPRTVSVVTGGATRDTARTTFELTCVKADKIAFSRVTTQPGGYYGSYDEPMIVVAHTDGSNFVALRRGNGPAWSPDGAKIAFASAECDSYYSYCYTVGLFVMNADGTGSVRLTSDGSDADAAWHPGGTQIAFTRTVGGRSVAYAMNATGSAAAPIALPSTLKAVFHLAWSPDGAKLAFTCEVDAGNTDICLANADGTGFLRLTSDPARDASPAWKPDGSKIAFSTTRYTGGHEVVVINPDGSGATRVLPGTEGIQSTWKPDGTKILFTGFRCDIYFGCTVLGLFSMNEDGTALTQITTGRDGAPAWRP